MPSLKENIPGESGPRKFLDAGSDSQFGFDRRPGGFKEDDPAMRRQAVRTVAPMLVVLLVAAAPARAASITLADVARAVGANGQFRPASEVRLRLGAQSGTVTTPNASTQSGNTASQQTQQPTTTGSQQTTPATTPTTPDQTLSQSGGNVQTVDLGDVTGTVCDCGEIPRLPIPKGGFPWWTLAGIPIICVSGICTPNHHENIPECVTGCSPPPPEVPEPMTLLLFGSGLLALGAGARRRHGRRQLLEETLNATAEEV